MPFIKALPEWNNAGTKPPASKITEGWLIGEKPVAAWWNWHLYNTYYALQELQQNAVHNEKLGAASGVATLGTDGKLTAAQLPAIGSAQITDGSITNNDLATDVKVGSLATLTTAAKTTVVAAINETKAAADAKIPLTQRAAANGVATLDGSSKVPIVQMPVLPTANIADGSITDAKLATDNKVGSLAALLTTSKGSAVAAINEVDADLSSHLNDAIRHITAAERSRWDSSQLFAITNSNGASKATVNADLNQTIATGFYNVLSGDANGQATAGHMIILNRGSTANALQILYTLNQKLYTRQTSDGGTTWTAWVEQETTAGAQSKVDAHAADAVKHITAAERNIWNAKASTAVATQSANGLQSAADKAKLDGIAPGAQTNQNAFSNILIDYNGPTLQADNATDTFAILAGKNITLTGDATNDTLTITNSTPDATTTVSGNMSAADKTKLNGVSTGANKVLNTANNGEISIDGVVAQVYSHPTTHPATMIVEDSTHRFVTDTEKANFETKPGAQTKADAARDAAIGFAKAYGLGSEATAFPTADLNNITAKTGFYNGANLTNAPAGNQGWHYIVHIRHANETGYILQIAVPFTVAGGLYFRTCNAGTWGNWINVANTDLASGTVNGLMSSANFTKLAGIATGANNYVHPTGDGNSHVPATGTTNNGKFLKAAGTANSASWQLIDWNDVNNKPSTFAPSAHGHAIADVTGLQAALDGKAPTVHDHADATTTADGFMAAADKVKLNGISTGANKTSNNATNGSISIDGTPITVYTHPATHDAAMIVESATKRFVSDTEKNTWNAKASTALATASANGLMSGADFSKLAGISAGANKVTNPATNGVIAIDGTNTTVYAHPTGDGNSHVPATGTTSNGKVLQAGSGANSASWQTLGISDISGLQTALNAPQQYKLTQDNGNGKVITQTDLNQVLAPGTYSVPAGSSLLNRPFNSTDLAILIVTGQDTTGNTVQKFINLENDWVGKTYTRVCRGGTWTAWKQELQTGDAQMFKLVDDNGMTNSITGYDLNGLTWSGFFYGNNLLNNPSGSTIYHRVWVMMSEPTSGVQIAMSNGGFMYIRHMTGGSWSAWTTAMTDRNILTGKVQITPTAANTPTGITLTFPVAFKSTPIVQVTPDSVVPGTSITGVSVSDETTTSCKIWLTATSTAKRTINYTAIDTKA